MASYRGQRIGRADYLSKSEHNAICDRCGFKVKSNHLKLQWNGLMCCDSSVNNCWESRNPQDFVRGVPDNSSVTPSRPDSNHARITYWPYPCIAGILLAGVSVTGTGFIKSNNANG